MIHPDKRYSDGVNGSSYKAGARIVTYRRPGGARYGYVDKNDTVTVLGKSGGYTQIKYPVNGGYKYGFVTNSDAERYITGASYEASIADGIYIIRSCLDYNKVVDAYGARAISNGTNIQLCSYNGGKNQQYEIKHVGNGWYKIICCSGNKSLDVRGAVNRDEVNIELFDWHAGDNQLWRFVSAGNGYYYIQNKMGRYMDVWNNQTADETNIQIYHFNGGNNQKWKMTVVSSVNTAPSTSGRTNSSFESQVGKTVAPTINTSGNLSYRAGYKGQCTWYAYGRFYEVNGVALRTARNAKYWLNDNRNESRVKISNSIQPKSVAVRTSGSYGHVMFVEDVTYSNGSPQYVYFTECNSDGNGVYNAGRDCIVKKLSYSSFVSQKKPSGYIVKK